MVMTKSRHSSFPGAFMDTDRIKLEARLFASEYLLCNLYAMLFRGSPDPNAAMEAFAAELRRHMEGFTVAGLEPVQSDFFAAEVRDALEILTGQLRDMVRKGGPGSSTGNSPGSPGGSPGGNPGFPPTNG
jgi:hypothetical protein